MLVKNPSTDLPTATEAEIVKYSYDDNHLPGKPDQKTEYISAKDLYGNTSSDTNLVSLITNYTYDKNGNLETVTTLSFPELFVSGIPEIPVSWKSAFLELSVILEVYSSKCQWQ